MAIKWKDSYSCKIEEIDNQHKKLFEIGNRIFTLASLKDDYDHFDEIQQILDELKQYTLYHFQYEEDLMKRYGYEKLEEHRLEHQFFVRKIQRIELKDIDTRQSEAIIEIVEFVADWVCGHIMKSDMEYTGFFHEKGIR